MTRAGPRKVARNGEQFKAAAMSDEEKKRVDAMWA